MQTVDYFFTFQIGLQGLFNLEDLSRAYKNGEWKVPTTLRPNTLPCGPKFRIQNEMT